LSRADEVKFVVGSRGDFEWACDRVREFDLVARVGSVLVSPVWGRVAHEQLAGWVLDSGLHLRMQVQLHKVIWPGAGRGV
jgi:7-carboxy-7-deazaguanine synthase